MITPFTLYKFAAIVSIEPVIGDGAPLCQKVKTMVADREAAVAAYKQQSGVSISATDLDQAVDL